MSHKKRDWSKYNKSLINRGSLTFWIAPEIANSWGAAVQEKRRGRPFTYADTAIETTAIIRYVFNLTLRSCEGFLISLFKLLNLDLSVPSYSQVCKRMKNIELPAHLLKGKAVRHVVMEATGLKVFGEGEWKVKKHGVSQRRGWKKLHLAVDEETQEVLFADLSTEYEADTKFIPEILQNRKGIEKLLMDGAGDNSWLYKLCFEEGVDLLTPPQKNARKHSEPWMRERNNRLLQILGLGGDKIAKSIWGKLSGYSKRVTVESAIARWKRLYGGHLKSRSPANQRFEVRIKAHILNKNLQLV